MKKVKIISGTYGFRLSSGIVEPKNVDSLPFEVSDEEASRLVALKVAEIVTEEPGKEESAVEDKASNEVEQPEETGKKVSNNSKKGKKNDKEPGKEESAVEETQATADDLGLEPQDIQ